MGLMYIFPTEDSEEEIKDGRVSILNNQLTLKTYGLPMVFWGYLAAILTVIVAMWMASDSVINKMFTYNDPVLTFLAILVRATLIIGPLVLISFYFYEKFIIKNKNEITLTHRLFFVPIITKKFSINSNDDIFVEHFLDSPNMAKTKNKLELKNFENKGYFELKAKSNGKIILIDRSSRKADLIKILGLLTKY